jgi:hypothetical protein
LISQAFAISAGLTKEDGAISMLKRQRNILGISLLTPGARITSMIVLSA